MSLSTAKRCCFLLQTSLKRKHWDGGANARHSALFQQQMRIATARQQPDEAMRDQVCTTRLTRFTTATAEAIACKHDRQPSGGHMRLGRWCWAAPCHMLHAFHLHHLAAGYQGIPAAEAQRSRWQEGACGACRHSCIAGGADFKACNRCDAHGLGPIWVLSSSCRGTDG